VDFQVCNDKFRSLAFELGAVLQLYQAHCIHCDLQRCNTITYSVAHKNFAQYFCTRITLSNINRFSNYCFTIRIRKKFCNNTISLKIPPHFKCVATLPCEMLLSGANCRSVSLITPLVIGVAGMSASFNSKADTLNIWCKNCRT